MEIMNPNLFAIKLEQTKNNKLKIVWNNGDEAEYQVRSLRLACPCASCIDEWTGQKRLKEKSIPNDIKPVKIHPVGQYAIQIYWSDNHNTGIYSFKFLHSLSDH